MPKTKNKARRPLYRAMRDKRYRNTEEAILEVLLESKTIPSTKEFARRAHISRSTLYRHHRAIPGIIPDYEKEILILFRQEIKKTLKHQRLDIGGVYLQILLFVIRHKRIFKILFKYGGDKAAESMILAVKDQIAQLQHLPKNSSRMLRIYAKEVAGIIEAWGEKDFSKHEISRVQKDIVYLTTTMRQRLSPINH